MPDHPANVQIRLATEQDIPMLHQLIELSVRGLQASDYTPAQIEGALGHALGLDTQLVSDRTYFVATSPPSPMLIACGGWSFRQTLFGSDNGPGRLGAILHPATDAAKIRAIFVHPAFGRQGLGSLLLQHCEAAAVAAGFRRVEMASTLTGIPLYLRRGYVPTNRIDVPLPNGEVLPVVHMTRLLGDGGTWGTSNPEGSTSGRDTRNRLKPHPCLTNQQPTTRPQTPNASSSTPTTSASPPASTQP